MSKYLSKRFDKLTPYIPGEQPKISNLIKLNTNESPFPPSPKAIAEAEIELSRLNLYSDPECTVLLKKLSEILGVKEEQVIATNGSDEILNFAFMAYCDNNTGVVFPDITYGFYKVFAELYNLEYKEIPLKDDLSIDYRDYLNAGKTIFIANPNAPTGIYLGLDKIEEILKSNPDNIVVIDEAYVDFGNESAVKLINKYNNLLVTGTFSKSRSMAGARLGFGVASKEIIKDLQAIRYSTNPYNVNRMTLAAGYGVLCDEEYTKSNLKEVIYNRDYLSDELKKLGFKMTDSTANFIFTKHEKISGELLYNKLRERNILVRYFNKEKISDYLRITIGTKDEMDKLIKNIKEIIREVL
ncbi:MAG: histidinol-phosphate transaminase [Ruminococcaceae bacterium]|nr:histidinol-phosphate transaminase [Oscillospiraceae bacterium]